MTDILCSAVLQASPGGGRELYGYNNPKGRGNKKTEAGISARIVPSAIKEMSRLVLSKKETVLGFSSYEYDEQGRLSRMRTFAPDGVPTELVSTDYFYEGESAVPHARVTSRPEKRTRTVR